jgi:ATP-independent RNA helicase DbpA
MTSILDRLSPALRQTVADIGFASLTPIQEQSIPVLLGGGDVIGQSKTGSGKTAAFVLPMLETIRPETRQVQALILCPTRELCAQVAREVRRFARRMPGLQALVVAGGMPFRPQAFALQSGVHVVVGTPGRILDHLGRRTLSLASVATLVLDEADRMLDMGFEDDMRTILDACPAQRQTALFSATFPAAIEAISRRYQRDPVRVTIADASGEQRATAPTIRQYVVEAMPDDKLAMLRWVLRDQRPESCLVFCNLKATASELAESLEATGVSAAPMHGDLEQRDRDKVLAKFRNRSIRVLVATDVAARGLDVESVDLVVNFDLPKPDSYVHRVGRTGRAGRTGIAVSICSPRERHKIDTIETYTAVTMQRLRPSAVAVQAAESPAATERQQAAMATLRIGGGRKNKIRPGDILGALTGEAGGLPGDAIGKIEIHDFFAYVAVRRDVAPAACRSLMAGRIKGRRLPVELVH